MAFVMTSRTTVMRCLRRWSLWWSLPCVKIMWLIIWIWKLHNSYVQSTMRVCYVENNFSSLQYFHDDPIQLVAICLSNIFQVPRFELNSDFSGAVLSISLPVMIVSVFRFVSYGETYWRQLSLLYSLDYLIENIPCTTWRNCIICQRLQIFSKS